jgi:hypothetical protein
VLGKLWLFVPMEGAAKLYFDVLFGGATVVTWKLEESIGYYFFG